jgi:hypothetical protein
MEISQVLQGGSVAKPASASIDSAFHPTRNTVWVNGLWFLSLSLSIAVSLAAMLAKQWCYYFLSARAGDAISQAEERQKRFNGLKDWRMRGILQLLPMLMHLSLG